MEERKKKEEAMTGENWNLKRWTWIFPTISGSKQGQN